MKELNEIEGSCLCEGVTFRVFGPVSAFHLCHCTRCRRSTGTAFAANIFTGPQNIQWLSGEDLIQRFELPSAKNFAKQFCKRCGSCLPYINRAKDKLVIPAGTLKSSFEIIPDDHIHWDSRALWFESGISLKRISDSA